MKYKVNKKNGLFKMNIIISLSLLLFLNGCKDKDDNNFVSVSVPLEQRTEVPCLIQKDDFVILTFGQSNADNSVSHIGETETKKSFEIFNKKCYLLQDPNLGTQNGTGDSQIAGGTVWTILGDEIINSKLAPHVYFVNIAFGGSSIASWNKGGTNYTYLNSTLDMLKQMDVNLTHVFWHQGETDSVLQTTGTDYYNMFMNIRDNIREYSEAPIFVARASLCGDSYSSEILNTQTMLSENNDDIFYGPNTDLIGYDFRRPDKCHFNYYGAVLHANGWLKSLTDYSNIK